MDQLPTQDIIQAAQNVLEGMEPETILPPLPPEYPADMVPYETPPAPALPPVQATSALRFGDIPTQLREPDGIADIYEIKKLNLAATLEALERAADAHEGFASPDASFAVAGLSEQVLKLTRDLEKSQDPRKLYNSIVEEVLQRLTERIVQSLATEMKWLVQESRGMLAPERGTQFNDLVKNAVNRVGPSMRDGLEASKNRLLRILNIKDKA